LQIYTIIFYKLSFTPEWTEKLVNIFVEEHLLVIYMVLLICVESKSLSFEIISFAPVLNADAVIARFILFNHVLRNFNILPNSLGNVVV